MYQLSDELLITSYKSAIALNLETEFILLMKLEIERRAFVKQNFSLGKTNQNVSSFSSQLNTPPYHSKA